MNDIIALVLACASVLLAVWAIGISKKDVRMQERQERRDFAAVLDDFAQKYTSAVIESQRPPSPSTGRPPMGPGPTNAYSPRVAALEAYAERLEQPGATKLTNWALDLLNGMRSGTSGMRPLEESMTIAIVASRWVRDPHDLSSAIADAKKPPAPAP